jgi:hypothetical protein
MTVEKTVRNRRRDLLIFDGFEPQMKPAAGLIRRDLLRLDQMVRSR